MISIFTDLTERSPTFGLSPIDTVGSEVKKSWIAMFTNATDQYHAWELFLGRRFKGLRSEIFLPEFENIEDPELKHKGIMSLGKTGKDQEDLYDFSISAENLKSNPVKPGDLALMAFLPHELEAILADSAHAKTFFEHTSLSSQVLLVLHKPD
jgi:N-acetylmuramic acid 6-phosphate etherase